MKIPYLVAALFAACAAVVGVGASIPAITAPARPRLPLPRYSLRARRLTPRWATCPSRRPIKWVG